MTNNTDITLCTLEAGADGRTVAYGTAGDKNGSPVLLFYPVEANRRILLMLHESAAAASLRLVCVNRPGTGGTTPAFGRGPAAHVDAACGDAIRVLEDLGVDQVGLLFVCAGAAFALSFASRYPDRLSGRLMGVAPYALPADCNQCGKLERFGARCCPNWLVSGFAGGFMGLMMGCFSSLPRSMLISRMRKHLSTEERKMYDQEYEGEDFFDKMAWIFQEESSKIPDISVMLSRGTDIGIDYRGIHGETVIFHGENDKVAPVASAEWLVRQLPSASLKKLPGGTHEGALFMLQPPIKEGLKLLHTVR